MQKIGLAAVLDDQDFQEGIQRYQNSVRTAEADTDRGAHGLSAAWIGAGAAIAIGIGLVEKAVSSLQSVLRAPLETLTSWAGELDALSDQFGMSGERASAWGYLMNRVGLSVEEGSGGLNAFVRNLAQSETALQQAAQTYSSSAQDITSSHADAMSRIAKDWTSAQADAAERQATIWADLAERKTSIEESLAENIGAINAALNRQLAQYAYDRAREEERFAKDGMRIDSEAAEARLEAEEQFQEDLAALRKDRAEDFERLQKDLAQSLKETEEDRLKSLFAIEQDSARSLEKLERDRIRSLEKLDIERARSQADVDEDAAKSLAQLTEQRDRRLAHARSYAELQAIHAQFDAEKAALEERAAERKKEIEERAAERRAEIEERAAEQRAEIEARRQERIAEAEARAVERKAEAEADARERRKEARQRATERQQEATQRRAERLAEIAEQRAERQKELAERRAEAEVEFNRRIQLAKEESALRIEEARKAAARQEEIAEKQAQREAEAVAKSLAKQDTARQEKFDAENKRFAEQMQKLQEALGKVQATNPTLAALEKLGVNLFDSTGKMRDFNALMPEIMDAFRRLPPGIESSAIAMDLFGRSGSKFLDFLRQGDVDMDAYIENLRAMGLLLSDEEINQAEQFEISWRELTLALKGFWITVGKEVMPLIKDLIGYVKSDVVPTFTRWAREHTPEVTATLKDLAAWVRDDVLPAVKQFVQWVIANYPEFQKTVLDGWHEIKPVLDEFIQWFRTDGVQALRDFLAAVRTLNEMVDIVSGVGSSVVGVSRALVDQFIGVWRAGTRLIHGDFLGWGEEIHATATNILRDLLSIWGINLDDLNALVRTKITESLTWIGSLPGQFYTLGVNIWQGLVDGIASVQDRLSEAFQGPLQSLIDLLNKLLEIGSPSKVFRRMGENMMLGLIEGFTSPRLKFAPTVVGETAARMVVPAQRMRMPGMLSGASGGANLTVNFWGAGGPTSQADAEMKTDWMVNALRGKGYDL